MDPQTLRICSVNSVCLTQVEVISRTIVRITSEEGNPEMSVQAKMMMMMTMAIHMGW